MAQALGSYGVGRRYYGAVQKEAMAQYRRNGAVQKEAMAQAVCYNYRRKLWRRQKEPSAQAEGMAQAECLTI